MHLVCKMKSAIVLGLLLAVGFSAQAEISIVGGKSMKVLSFPGKVKIEYMGQATDILFVVDDSGSMGSHQANLAKNIDLFLGQLQSLSDFHIGVITTSCNGFYDPKCGVLNNGFVTPGTPDLVATLRNNILVGTHGSGTEMPFQAITTALSPDLQSGANAGFLRKDAQLLIVFVTDAEDQSEDSVALGLADRLLEVKGREDLLAVSGIIVPSGVNDCDRDAGESPVRIEELIARFGSQASSLCSPTYGDDLVRMAQSVTGLSRRIPLLLEPLVETIRVFFNGIEIPTGILGEGWAYSPEVNEVVIGELVDLSGAPEKTPVVVEFVPADKN